jgi:hypothetical protein
VGSTHDAAKAQRPVATSLRGVVYPRRAAAEVPDADILQLDVVDVMMPSAAVAYTGGSTAAERHLARKHEATRHGGALGIFDDSDDDEDIIADSDDDAPKTDSDARGGATLDKAVDESASSVTATTFHDSSAVTPAASTAPRIPPSKVRSHKAVSSKMHNHGV